MAKDYLIHHGVKGQKWGIRRYQNDDGTLTEEGKKRQNEIAELLGKNYKIDQAIKEGKEKNREILIPKGEKEKYLQRKKEIDNLISKYSKDKSIDFLTSTYSENGKKYIAVALIDYNDTKTKIQDIPIDRISFYGID